MIEIIAGGMLATVQDAGRHGLRRFGVSPSGPADRTSARLANRLVGNGPGLPLLEVTLGGLVCRVAREVLVAITGAPTPLTIDGHAIAGPVVRIAAGQTLTVGRPHRGLRSYLAVAGGFVTEPVLGSCSRDQLAHLGPRPLTEGDTVEIGDATARAPELPDVVPWRSDPALGIEVWAGPHVEWFGPGAITALTSGHWLVTDADRVACRLAPGTLAGRPDRQLATIGLVRGAIQVTGDGTAIVMGADHPTTGGYPVVAVTSELGADRVAQAVPGSMITFQVAEVRSA